MREQKPPGCTKGNLFALVAATPAAQPIDLGLKALTLKQLRSAIRSNAVSFPSQMPLLTQRLKEDQWRIAHLYFIAGWGFEH